MLEIAFATPTLPASGALALLIAEASAPSGLWAAADRATGGAIARALERRGSPGPRARLRPSWHPAAGFRASSRSGWASPTRSRRRRWRRRPAAPPRHSSRTKPRRLAADGLTATQAAAAAMGATLARYRFDRYRTKEKPEDKPRLARLTVLADDPDAARAAWTPARAVAEGVALARDLVSEPANVLNPAEMARALPGADAARPRRRGDGTEGAGKARLRRAARRGDGQRQRGAGRGDAVARRVRCQGRCRPRDAPRSPSSARASPSTPAASASSPPAAWRT